MANTLNATTMRALASLSTVQLELNRSTQKLATGLRISRGADDPAGLIASERLRATLAALDAESAALQRSDQVASTADAAVGEISGLLAEANGLEVQLANGGALSSDEKVAIQGQIDSILNSVDRIAAGTTFNGQSLLDGSLTLQANSDTIDVPSTSTLNLGETEIDGTTYHLSDIGSNGALGNDPARAQQVLDTAITNVATARGRIGAFQANTIRPRLNALNVAVENIASAESIIRDTDFAAETANLARLSVLGRASILSIGIAQDRERSALDLLA